MPKNLKNQKRSIGLVGVTVMVAESSDRVQSGSDGDATCTSSLSGKKQLVRKLLV